MLGLGMRNDFFLSFVLLQFPADISVRGFVGRCHITIAAFFAGRKKTVAQVLLQRNPKESVSGPAVNFQT